ncbi:MAG: hypothetical protein ACFFDI_33330, partial [Promethearchaeota archaeon]
RDAEEDKDHDGMKNLWEYQHGFDPTSSIDASQDPDGDWISNLDEYKSGTDPHDRNDSPLFVSSFPFVSVHVYYFLLLLSLLLIVVGLLVVTVVFAQKRRKSMLVSALGAPDYITAVKIRRLGLKNYTELQKEVKKAKGIIKEGNLSYIRGELTDAVQLYGQTLKQYSAYMNDPLVAETIFNGAWVLKELGLLSTESPILSYVLESTDVPTSVNALQNMLEALLAEEEKNWGLANKAWQEALNYEELPTKYKAICQGALINLDFRDWLNNPILPDHDKLVVKLNEWQEFCKNNGVYDSLCWAYLTHARISLAAMQFDEAEEWFDECESIARQYQIHYYQEVAQRETEVFEKHKKKIHALTGEGEPLSPTIQTQLVQEYLIKAKALVQEDQEKSENRIKES